MLAPWTQPVPRAIGVGMASVAGIGVVAGVAGGADGACTVDSAGATIGVGMTCVAVT